MTMEKLNKILAVLVIVLTAVCWALGSRSCKEGQPSDTLSVRVDSFIDTLTVVVHDTVPKKISERIVEYVSIPVINDGDTAVVDSVEMAIVQKEYSDDSTYHAYVSGIDYGQWPKLDSIDVQTRIINKLVRETVTIEKKKSRWSIGAQAGYGYGFMSGKFEPYAGVGISFRIF